MQPSALIPVIFLFALHGAWAQESPDIRTARAVEEPSPAPELPELAPAKSAKRADTKADPSATKSTALPAGAPVEAGAGAAMNAAALLPIGVPSYDVRMPEFDEEHLISRMRVRELTRIDGDHLDMRTMDLERYLPGGGLDYVVLIERGFYELSTGRLVSSSPTRLRGKSIDLHGEGCVYSRDSEVIKILGKVTSYIYVEKDQMKKPAEKNPSDQTKATPSPTAGPQARQP